MPSVIVLAGEDGSVSAFHNVCRHRGTRLCHADEGQLPGRIQCPYHAWTYGLDGRLLSAPHMEKVAGFAEADYPLQPVATAVWDGHVFINLSERPRPFAEHLAGLPAKFAPWGMADLRLAERRVVPAQGELEAHHPELLGMPPLPDRAPAAQPAVALHERGQRAAAADLPRRAHGPARGHQDALHGRPDDPRLPARPGSGRSAPRLLLRDPPEPPPQPAPGLHVDVHDVAAGGGPHRRHLRVAFPSRPDGPGGLRPAGRGRVLGDHEPPGLGALRAGPGGDLVPRLSARAPTRIARSCCRPSTASCSRGRPLRDPAPPRPASPA